MKFCWTTIMVKEMEESLKFYQEVIGLKVNRRFASGPDVEIVFLGDGETQVELICNKVKTYDALGSSISLGFEVNSIDEKISEISEKGLNVYEGPFQPNPFIRFFYVLDPNGLKIQFVENIKSK